MAGKLTFLVGAAAGYVLGARSGRERYDQIAGQAQRLWKDPRVKDAKQKVQHAAQEHMPGSNGGSGSGSGSTSGSSTSGSSTSSTGGSTGSSTGGSTGSGTSGSTSGGTSGSTSGGTGYGSGASGR